VKKEVNEKRNKENLLILKLTSLLPDENDNSDVSKVVEDLIIRNEKRYDTPLNNIFKEVYCECLEILLKNCETRVKKLESIIQKKE
jgi:hypothetical protein